MERYTHTHTLGNSDRARLHFSTSMHIPQCKDQLSAMPRCETQPKARA